MGEHMKKPVGTINLAPSWLTIVRMTRAFTERGEHRAAAAFWSELERLASIVDEQNDRKAGA